MQKQEPCSLVVLPLGDRALDGLYMLEVAGSRPRRFLVNGWTGFSYSYGLQLGRLFSRGDWVPACRDLALLWPDPLLVVDRELLGLLRDPARLPHHGTNSAQGSAPGLPGPVLHRVPPHGAAGTRPALRTLAALDLLERVKRIHFQARCLDAGGGKPALLYVNDCIKARYTLGPEWQTYDLKLSDPDLSILTTPSPWCRRPDTPRAWR